MTIKNQFFILIGFVIAAMLLQLALNHRNADSLIRLNQQSVTLAKIETGMLMLRRNEKDFMARNDLKYVNSYEENHSLLLLQVRELRDRLASIDIPVERIEEIETVLNEYAEKFRALVNVQKMIGLSHKDGLYGGLRTAVHGVDKLVRQQGDYQLLSDMLMLRRNEKDFMLRSDQKYVEKHNKNLAKFEHTLSGSVISYDAKEQIKQALGQYRNDFLSLVDGYKKKGLSSSQGLHGELRQVVHQTETLLKQIDEEITGVISEQVTLGSIRTLGVSLLLIITLVGVLLWLSRSIRGPLDKFQAVFIQASSDRDLTLRAENGSDSEIGAMAKGFNKMMIEFQSLLQQVTDSAQQVAAESDRVIKIASTTTAGVEQQRIESDQVATALTQMSATVEEVARNTAQAAEISRKADEETGQGASVVAQSVEGIQRLAQQVTETSSTINELAVESDNINTVLSVITSIAEQTNLLALNAAIEAARAGEQGRGFAVVADEVRTLAQRSQTSAGEIKQIIERLQSKAQAATKAMEAGQEQSSLSAKQAQQGESSLKNISSSISDIRDMNDQIATAAEEQSQVAESVSEHVVLIARVADDTAKGAVTMTQSITELTGLAEQLQASVKQFTV
ncbi:MAG: HAMP domain-containing methyl-accepting chemotaxis protein [Candidatus Thiodiazotropha sp. (ex Ustalcina ferruginea)]|nr:HAMP domain-containing methyl-accepting chemotaxis protein [Candidatus Thiodiazotropha sp. (ex Ustalcina ferruginea)]